MITSSSSSRRCRRRRIKEQKKQPKKKYISFDSFFFKFYFIRITDNKNITYKKKNYKSCSSYGITSHFYIFYLNVSYYYLMFIDIKKLFISKLKKKKTKNKKIILRLHQILSKFLNFTHLILLMVTNFYIYIYKCEGKFEFFSFIYIFIGHFFFSSFF